MENTLSRPKKAFKTIDEYISGFPKEAQVVLRELRQEIRKSAPEAEETISYGIPTFDLNGFHLVHFAAYKNHIGFYPTSSGIRAFQKDLSSFKTSKGAVRFPLTEPIPFDLVRKIVRFRVKENMSINK